MSMSIQNETMCMLSSKLIYISISHIQSLPEISKTTSKECKQTNMLENNKG